MPKITMEFTLNPNMTEAERVSFILAFHSLYEGMSHLPGVETSQYHNGYAPDTDFRACQSAFQSF